METSGLRASSAKRDLQAEVADVLCQGRRLLLCLKSYACKQSGALCACQILVLPQMHELITCGLGLSVAEVIEVKGRSITLGGADIVDGSPILDIKPYVPFCDSVSQASAPSWVSMCPVTTLPCKAMPGNTA